MNKVKKSKKNNYTVEELENMKNSQQVIDMYIENIDENLNMLGVIGSNIKAYIPRNEASSIVGDDGLVEEKHIINKKNKVIPVCIKEIIKNDDGSIELVMSKRVLELKVRKWMYMHLKPGMKLRGVVVSTTEYAAFVDVGGGVTGILKLQDMSDSMLQNASDMFKVSQRIEVVVKKYDRELLGSFEENIKKYHEGDIVDGIIRNRIKSGVFVELQPNLVGLAEYKEGFEYGQKVNVYIKKIIKERKKIKLLII